MEDLKKKSSSDSSWSDENEVVRKKDFQVVKQVRKLSVFLKSASMIISFMFFFSLFPTGDEKNSCMWKVVFVCGWRF